MTEFNHFKHGIFSGDGTIEIKKSNVVLQCYLIEERDIF